MQLKKGDMVWFKHDRYLLKNNPHYEQAIGLIKEIKSSGILVYWFTHNGVCTTCSKQFFIKIIPCINDLTALIE